MFFSEVPDLLLRQVDYTLECPQRKHDIWVNETIIVFFTEIFA